MARRFLIDRAPQDGVALLRGSEQRHLRRVLRARTGLVVEVADPEGGLWRGTVAAMEGQSVRIEGLEALPAPVLPRPVRLAVAAPNASRLDAFIPALSELGARALLPILAERTQRPPSTARVDRWRRIADLSIKQCGRAGPLVIEDPCSLADLLEDLPDGERLVVCDVAETGDGIDAAAFAGGDPVLVLVGPEGGWSDAERDQIRAAGAVPVCLGPLTLRIETAAVAACAVAVAGPA